ncbi:hypothetical protein ASPBRDRAFT_482298 [Aspergillus brasiliensis CBS 101740]|uniref:Uncharacterized protein n=1 Tax=Aspergillus brasiliensis (strain CBS 101740 / IMI 381727 / IBT 21946) TaxID=767769 RepID=A0A1L9UU79_ASPBC|nr:hypothetical protein ASPBRDRAFT_482298 [Aspergillus brasiliensis CBS 101740]
MGGRQARSKLKITLTVGDNLLSRKHKNIKIKEKITTYNRRDSLVVTHPTTNLPACGLSTAERTGSPIFHTLWSYVRDLSWMRIM